MNYRFYIALLLCFSFWGATYAQNLSFVFSDTNLEDVFQEIENQTDWIFNYNPNIVSPHSFSGKLELTPNENWLTQLFEKMPLDFKILENGIIVFPQEAREIQICGRVKDYLSETPLAFANIITNDKIHGTQTDENGYFEFSFSAYKNQEFTISYIGYQNHTIPIRTFPKEDCPHYFLKINPDLFGGEIIVTDYILDGITQGEAYSSTTIDYHRLSKNQPNIEQDLLKTTQFLPGVSSIDESAANILIRGGTADQNLMVWEGATLYQPGHLFGMISTINPFVVDKVGVYKGVFHPSHDNRVGGLIDISLSDSIPENWQGGFGTTLSEAHAFSHFPIVKNKLSVTLAGRKTINGLFPSPTLNNYLGKVFQETLIDDQRDDIEEGYGEADQGLSFYDWNAKILIQPFEKLSLKASYFNSHDVFRYESLFTEDNFESFDSVQFKSAALNLSANYEWNKYWKSEISYKSSNYANDYHTFSADILEEEEEGEFFSSRGFNDIKDQTFVFSNHLQFFPEWNVQFGYDYDTKEVNFNYSTRAAFEEDESDENFAGAAFHNGFMAFNYKNKNWQLNGGLRGTYYSTNESFAWSPRLNIQYALNENVKLRASAGILQQYISQLMEFGENELNINHRIWVLSENEGGAFQRSQKISTGLIFNKNGWLIDAEIYQNQTKDLFTFSLQLEIEGQDFSVGDATARGLDILVKKRWNNYQLWLSYALSKVDFYFPEIQGNAFSAPHDQRHNLSIINSFQHKNWNFSMSYQFRSGLPYSVPAFVKEIEEVNEEGELEQFYELEYEVVNSQRLPLYSRLDLGVHYQIPFKSSRLKSEIAFSLINLLNQSNTFSRNYFLEDIDDDDVPEILFIERELLRITPQMLVRFYW